MSQIRAVWCRQRKGDWYFLTHHGNGDWEGRCASLLPVTWVDGWPIIGKVGADGIGRMEWEEKKPVENCAIVLPQSDDTFAGPELGMQWEWNHQPRADKWSLIERPGHMRLHAFKPLERDNLRKVGNILTQRVMRTPSNTATVELDLGGLADGQIAGLCHFSKDSSAIRVRREGGANTIETIQDQTVTKGEALKVTKIWLRSTWGSSGVSGYSYSTDGKSSFLWVGTIN